MPVDIARQAVKTTEELLLLSRMRLGFRERIRGKKLERMLTDESGKTLTLQIADQVFRSKSPREQSREFSRLLKHHGVPRYLWWWERLLMYSGRFFSRIFPQLVMPLVEGYIKSESQNVIKPAEANLLSRYITERRGGGFSINLNILGEAVLGEEEANRRLDEIIARLEHPEVDYISVKISAIFSQINLVAFDLSLKHLEDRLRKIYRAARSNSLTDSQSGPVQKFVNLDMEDYRDFDLTIAVFRNVLSEPEFMDLEAGIVLQAYIPDSAIAQEELTSWARERVSSGGACIKIRLVKGANLAMEQMEASMHGWHQAPYENKADSDANFKRMVRYGCRELNARAVRIGIGSHNLFDISYAMICAHEHGVSDRVEFEMLEGMANHQASALLSQSGHLLLYSPVVEKRHFHSALAYLVRRLDENTSEENYLRHMFLMTPGTSAWESEKTKFLDACSRAEDVSSAPRRNQDRLQEIKPADQGSRVFINSPDTDWSLPVNRTWISRVMEKWINVLPDPIPMQAGGKFKYNSSAEVAVFDPSRPGHRSYLHTLAGPEDVDRSLETATAAFQKWSKTSFLHRSAILKTAGHILETQRGDTIGCLVLDGAKAVNEADSEISEAIDFANYYSLLDEVKGIEGCDFKGRGVVVVAPPWNFPYAIPAGGVLAALAAGNSVILKPSLHTVLSSYRLAHQLWEAGVPKEVLQFLPCPEDNTGRSLITDSRVDTVILTGSYKTGKLFQNWRPDLHLIAETSGKNAMVITAASDAEQAAHDLVYSAFGHSGQKCSAASLALVEAEIYHRDDFRRQLRDAAQSLHVGSAWDMRSVVTPLVDPPGEDLTRALTTLDEGEEWLLKPSRNEENPNLWSPGIKLGVKSDGWFANTECFGPVLGIIRVKNLDEAIAIQNSGAFGLTGGIQSLNPDEIGKWSNEVMLGNAYVNRSITGAIVRRQPFGGWGNSSFGPGAKAGGPDYAMNFVHWSHASSPQQHLTICNEAEILLNAVRNHQLNKESVSRLNEAAGHYQWAYSEVFSQSHDPTKLIAERNVLQYHAHNKLIYRIEDGDITVQTILTALGSVITGISLELSLPPQSLDPSIKEQLQAHDRIIIHSEKSRTLADRLSACGGSHLAGAIRSTSMASPELQKVANDLHIPIIIGEVLRNGRLELRHWFREKCVSETTHRYGNILPRFRSN